MQITNFQKFTAVSSGETNFLIDIMPDFENKLASSGIHGFNFILVTDPAKCYGLSPLKNFMLKRDIDKLNIFASKQHIEDLKEVHGSSNLFNFIPLKFDKTFKPDGKQLEVLALSGENKGGFVIGDYVCLSFVPSEVTNIFRGKKLIYVDTGDFQGAVDFLKEANPDKTLLHNAYFDLDKEIQLQGMLSETSFLARDGMMFDIPLSFNDVLYDHNKSLAVMSVLPEEIWRGKKTNIILSEHKRDLVNKISYLVKDDFAFGLLRLKHPVRILKSQLDNFRGQHLLSDNLIDKKFGRKHYVYSYEFDMIEKFDKIMVVNWEDKDNCIVKSVEDYSTPPISTKNIEELLRNHYFLSVQDLNTDDIRSRLDDLKVNEKTIKIYTFIPDELPLETTNTVSIENFILPTIEGDKLIGFNISEQKASEFMEVIKDHISANYNINKFNLVKGEAESYGLVFEIAYEDYDNDYSHTEFTQIEDVGGDYFYEGIGKNYLFLTSGEQVLIKRKEDDLFLFDLQNTPVDISADLKNSIINITTKDFVAEGFLFDEKLELFDLKSFNRIFFDGNYLERYNGLGANFNYNLNVNKVKIIGVDNNKFLKDHIEILKMSSSGKIGIIQEPVGHAFIMNTHKEMTMGEENPKKKEVIRNLGFFKRWSDGMAYILGFLSTDGYLDTKSNRIEFGIHPQDRDILDWFAKQIGGIKPKMMNNSLVLRFKSKEMAADLIKLGMGVKKPIRTTYSKIPSKYKWSYIRGVFDADGNVGEDRLQVDNNAFKSLEWLTKNFKSIAGDDVKFYKYANLGKIVVLNTNGGANKLFSKIYSGSGPKSKRKSSKKFPNKKVKEE